MDACTRSAFRFHSTLMVKTETETRGNTMKGFLGKNRNDLRVDFGSIFRCDFGGIQIGKAIRLRTRSHGKPCSQFEETLTWRIEIDERLMAKRKQRSRERSFKDNPALLLAM